MSKQPGNRNTLRSVVEEILRLHVEEGYTYRQLAAKFQKPFKTIQNMIHNEYKKQRKLLECGKVPRSPSRPDEFIWLDHVVQASIRLFHFPFC